MIILKCVKQANVWKHLLKWKVYFLWELQLLLNEMKKLFSKSRALLPDKDKVFSKYLVSVR